MDDSINTPPYTGLPTPIMKPVSEPIADYATPMSQSSTYLDTAFERLKIPTNVTQAMVHANPQFKRFQQDLLVLTSFCDNETLHWRPSWFQQDPHSATFWTLYNPPNVVTERLPYRRLGRLVYTRRMRRPEDPAPNHIKTWDHWYRVCDLRGIPHDFLCEEQITLLRLGLPRDAKGRLIAPPSYPLYPEPQPEGHGRYLLSPSVYESHLTPKFHNLRTDEADIEDVQVVVVHSSGEMKIESREDYFLHASQWTHFDGNGAYTADVKYVPDMNAPKDQAWGRRWSYLPWTKEMEESCGKVVKLKMKLRGWNNTV